MPERVIRHDRGTLRSPRRTENGRMRVDGVFTRAGVFEYRRLDGTVQRELRPPEEVFAPQSLRSLEILPVIEDHPRDGLIKGDSARAQGWTLEGVHQEGDLIVGSLLITDPDLVEAIEHGKRALSVGYEVEYDRTPGVHPTYGRYDGVQRSIRGDHLAVVDVGRAGPEARLRMDSAGVHAPPVPTHLTLTDRPVTLGANMDDLKKLQEALADATARADKAERALAEAAKRADAAEGTAESLRADLVAAREAGKRADSIPEIEAKLAKAEADLAAERKRRADAEDPKRFSTAVQARVKLESSARAILGDAFRADLDDRTLMVSALEKVQGPLADKDQRSDDYIRARFDAAAESFAAGERALRTREEERIVEEKTVTRVDSRSAREKMIEDNRTLKPLRSAGQ